MRILIADDSESVRFALRMAVESLGHQVVGLACNGRQALEQYPQQQPDVVVMDVIMPEMDGLACTTLLAQQNPSARVLIMSGDRYNDEDARRVGAKGYLPKPFGLLELDQLLHAAAAA